MSRPTEFPVAILGLGEMGSALVSTLLDAGVKPIVWNRTEGRGDALIERGAMRATTVAEAVTQANVIVPCLYNHGSVHETLDPIAAALAGRTLINVTTTTPNESRELATWAGSHCIDFLDGAIMATPPMIGSREGSILYSGPRHIFEAHRDLLDIWASSTFEGEDAGLAALLDLALLSAMYTMFAGFLHGAAMAGTAGVPAKEFAARATPFLTAMTAAFADDATVIDGGDYSVPGQQSLDWTDLHPIARASTEAGVDPGVLTVIQKMIDDQVDAGHGSDAFARIYESFRRLT